MRGVVTEILLNVSSRMPLVTYWGKSETTSDRSLHFHLSSTLSYHTAGLETIRAVNYMLNQIYSPYSVLETILAHMEQKRGVCALICSAVYHRVNTDNYSHL